MTVGPGSSGDTARPWRVLLVDDDPFVRTMLARILASADDIEVVGEAADGADAVTQTTLHRPDVVVMDIRMRPVNGLVGTARITALPHAPKVLVLTTFNLDQYVFDSLDAGASGFLLKDASPEEIIEAVRIVAAGEAILSPGPTRTLIGHFTAARADPRRVQARNKLDLLTEREKEIVKAVAQGKPNATIGSELYLSPATVKTHITRIFAKLDVTNRVQITIFAYETGLVS